MSSFCTVYLHYKCEDGSGDGAHLCHASRPGLDCVWRLLVFQLELTAALVGTELLYEGPSLQSLQVCSQPAAPYDLLLLTTCCPAGAAWGCAERILLLFTNFVLSSHMLYIANASVLSVEMLDSIIKIIIIEGQTTLSVCWRGCLPSLLFAHRCSLPSLTYSTSGWDLRTGRKSSLTSTCRRTATRGERYWWMISQHYIL